MGGLCDVTRIRADWNLIRTELQKWLEFRDRINGGQNGNNSFNAAECEATNFE
jgi:hypothetical protein